MLWKEVAEKFPSTWKNNTFIIEGDNEYIEHLLSLSNPLAIKKWGEDNKKKTDHSISISSE